MKQIYTLLILLCTTTLFGQTKFMEVIATAGGFGTGESTGISLSWTLGEAVVGTLNSSNQTLMLTQGFHQGSLLGTGIDYPSFSNKQFALYPNPASNQANIVLRNLPQSLIEIRVYNLTGTLIHYQKQVETGLGNYIEIPLTVSAYKPGLYLVRLVSNGKTLSTLKLVKE